MAFSQAAPARCRNVLVAQLFNRLGANSLSSDPVVFEGCRATVGR